MNYKKLLIGAALAAAAVIACGFDAAGHCPKLIEDTYTVRQDDTLWSISARYMDRNTYGPRDIREFMAGIVEINYDHIFKGRQPGEIYPGDKLKINYWVEDKEADNDRYSN